MRGALVLDSVREVFLHIHSSHGIGGYSFHIAGRFTPGSAGSRLTAPRLGAIN